MHKADYLPFVYTELRALARARLAGERPGHTLDATALVHEAFLKIGADQRFEDRGHFFAAAGEAMRRVLVDSARARLAAKRGGGGRRVELGDLPADDGDRKLIELNDALELLKAEDPDTARVVELKHFAGLNHDQVAEALGITVYEARQQWTFARAWLFATLRPV